MPVLKKILPVVLILALLYGAVLLGERMTTQELKRVTSPATQEAVCLMWQPRLLSGKGVCYLNLLNPQGKVTGTAEVAVLDTGLTALQQFGQIGFQGEEITVANQQTGELVRRFVVRGGRLSAND